MSQDAKPMMCSRHGKSECAECFHYPKSVPETIAPIVCNEQVKFRLIQMPCCGQLLCWVNPRLPNFCPECSRPVHSILRANQGLPHFQLVDEEAWLKYHVQGKLL